MQLTINPNDPDEVRTALVMLASLPAANTYEAPKPTPAPSTAGAVQSSTAPEVPQVSLMTQAATELPVVMLDPEVAAPTATPTLPAADANGLPWDHRIHASSKALNANGTWRAKRGVDDALVAQVEAELKGAGSQPPQASAPTYNPGIVIFEKDPAEVFSVANPFVATNLQAAPTTLIELMPIVSAAVIGGKLPATALMDACAAVGLGSVVALQTAPDKVPAVWAILNEKAGGLL